MSRRNAFLFVVVVAAAATAAAVVVIVCPSSAARQQKQDYSFEFIVADRRQHGLVGPETGGEDVIRSEVGDHIHITFCARVCEMSSICSRQLVDVHYCCTGNGCVRQQTYE